MPKKQSFSIYLIKEGIEIDAVLNEETQLQAIENVHALPDGGSFFLLDSFPRSPWWKDFFGIEQALNQVLKGGLLLLPVNDRLFALTFGHVAHNLKDTAYVHDFGLRVTLNCVDPEKIKNTDTLAPYSSLRQRRQFAGDAIFAEFGYDGFTEIVKSLTGKVKEKYLDLFTSATGSAQLRIATDATSEELADLCAEFLDLYEREDYKDVFQEIDNLQPIRDPIDISVLDEKLLNAFEEPDDIGLAVPDMVDFRESVLIRFGGAGGARSQPEDEIRFANYIAYASERLNGLEINIDILRKHHLFLSDDDGARKGPNFSIYRSIVFDTTIEDDEGSVYHLCDGVWYRVASDFIVQMREYLDAAWRPQTLPDYNHENEGHYNDSAPAIADEVIACLDRKNIAPVGQTQIEPCDLVALKDDELLLVHVKRSTGSQGLSHLFNQGFNSATLLQRLDTAKERLAALIEEEFPDFGAPQLRSINDLEFRVYFGIVTHKNPEGKSDNFPLFSRIALYRVMQNLNDRRFKFSFEFIADRTSDQ